MLRRILEAVRDAFTPHPERFDNSAEVAFMAATIEAPTRAAVIQAAEVESDTARGGR